MANSTWFDIEEERWPIVQDKVRRSIQIHTPFAVDSLQREDLSVTFDPSQLTAISKAKMIHKDTQKLKDTQILLKDTQILKYAQILKDTQILKYAQILKL